MSASCWAATASSPGATTAKEMLRDDAAHHPQGGGLARARTTRRRPSAARRVAPCRPTQRRAVARVLMPAIRGRISKAERKVGALQRQRPRCWSSSTPAELRRARARWAPPAPTISCAPRSARSCCDFDPAKPDVGRAGRPARRADRRLPRRLRGLLRALQAAGQPGHARPQRGRSILVPGVGMITFAKDKATARIAGEFYVNAINVMRGAAGVDRYVGLPEQEAFDIEYWLLEEAKLQRMPKPKSLAGRVAFVTGGAGGIGSAIADALPARGRLRGAGRHRPGRARPARRRVRQALRQGLRARRRSST